MSLMDDIKDEYGITREDPPIGVITPPSNRRHTSPYVHQVDDGYLTVINYSDYNELSKQQYINQQTVMTTIVFDIKNLISFLDEGLYGYSESYLSSEEIISNAVINYPYTEYPSNLINSPMIKSSYIAVMAELSHRFITVGIYNHIPEHVITKNGYLIVRVPAILTHQTKIGETK